MSEGAKAVYRAIAAVQSELAQRGLPKDRKNAQQGYAFRGIDDVYGALAPILSAKGLCFLPRVLRREHEERLSKTGGALNYVTVECEFDLVSVEDGSTHTIRTFGEAMDSADKATNKAMSAAYKYAAMQAFCIPVAGEDNDADAKTHDPAPRSSAPPPPHAQPRRLAATAPSCDPVKDPGPFPSAAELPGTLKINGMIEDVSVKEGAGAKGAWTKYGVKINNEWYGTFDTGHGETARMMRDDGIEVTVEWEADKKNPKYKNLTNIYSYEPDTSFDYGDNAIPPPAP